MVEVQGARLPQVFNGTSSKVSGFVEECKTYIEKKMKGVKTEEQILWALSYVQGELTDIWKKEVLEELDEGLWEYRTVEKFLEEIKKKFGRKEKKEKKKVWENLDKELQGFLEDMEKEFGKNLKKEKEKSYRVEKDIWGEIDSFCDRYNEGNRKEEVRQVERKKEVKKERPTVEATMSRKQMARKGDKSGYWMR